MVLFFFKKHTLPSKMKKYGVTNSKELFFFHGKTNSCGVAIGFVGAKALNILNIKRDNLGRILVIEVKIDDSVFVLINIYNANTDPEQRHTLDDLLNILETLEDIQNKSVVLGGDFNVILNPSLDSEGDKPVIKKKTIAKLIQNNRKSRPLRYLENFATLIFSYPILSKNLFKSRVL